MTSIVLFCSVPVLAGALLQIPVGRASDRFDRRKILVLLAIMAILAESIFLTVNPRTGTENILIGSLLGAAMFAMYPIVLAHANDHAELGQSLQISGGLLMFFGYGSIIGPFVGGVDDRSGGAFLDHDQFPYSDRSVYDLENEPARPRQIR